ncbi:MAG: hypothetical protein ACFCUN_02365 [Hyphomicrobiaceae bacterium]
MLAIVLSVVFMLSTAIARDPDPRPVLGAPTGPATIVMIGPGLDYNAAHNVQRIARDGEGDLVGWDFIDDDSSPFGATEAEPPMVAALLAATRGAIAPVRADLNHRASVAALAGFLSYVPGVLAVASHPDSSDALLSLLELAARLPDRRVVTPAPVSEAAIIEALSTLPKGAAMPSNIVWTTTPNNKAFQVAAAELNQILIVVAEPQTLPSPHEPSMAKAFAAIVAILAEPGAQDQQVRSMIEAARAGVPVLVEIGPRWQVVGEQPER